MLLNIAALDYINLRNTSMFVLADFDNYRNNYHGDHHLSSNMYRKQFRITVLRYFDS